MNRKVIRIILGAALFCSMFASEQAAATEEPAIVAQDLKKLRSPAVAAVLWTRRTSYYTLQIVFPNMGRLIRTPKANPGMNPGRPAVQMWLMKADGSIIPPVWRSTEVSAKSQVHVGPSSDVLFRFPLSAGQEAVAAAIQIGDTFMVDQIEPFKD